MNSFYQQPKVIQWIVAVLLMIAALIPALLIIIAGNENPLYYLLFLVLIPIIQFCFAPFNTLTGTYKYYSPLLLGYNPNKREIDLHNGTSFDYLFVMRKTKPGIPFKRSLLRYHLEGLLAIIRDIENKAVPETVNIVGTSYFFNERTLKKLNFNLEEPSVLYRINIFANAIDLIWMYSLAQGKFSIPKMWHAKKASITGAKLVEAKASITELHRKLAGRGK